VFDAREGGQGEGNSCHGLPPDGSFETVSSDLPLQPLFATTETEVDTLARQPHGSVLALWHDFEASRSFATVSSLSGSESQVEHMRAVGTSDI